MGTFTDLQRSFAYRLSTWASQFVQWIDAVSSSLDTIVAGTNGQQLITLGTAIAWLGIKTADLANADSTLVVATANQFILQPATLSANRTKTLGTAGAVANESITIVRLDTTANTLAIVNGGTGAGTLYTFPAGVKRQATFTFDGVDWYMSSTVALV